MSISRLKKVVLAPTLVAAAFFFVSCGSERSKSGDLFSDMDKDHASDDSSDSASADTSGGDAPMAGMSRFNGGGSGNAEENSANVDPTVLGDNKALSEKADGSAATLEAAAPEAAVTSPVATKADTASLPGDKKDVVAQNTVPSPEPTPEMNAAIGAPTTPTVPELLTGKEVASAAPAAVTDVAVAPKKTSGKKVGRSLAMKTPAIPTESIWRKGQSLNRFYFVRSNDTPSSVATIVYGDMAKANQLVEWNGDDWKAGTVIFYASPDQPTDGNMKSLFDEREIAPSSYTVSKGDKISKIAETVYGSSLSWKEIAAMNKLGSPVKLTKGQQLILYPAQISPRVVAAVPEPAKPVTAENIAKPADAVHPDIAASALRQPAAQKPSGKVGAVNAKSPKGDEDLASAEDVGSFFEDHLVGIVAAVVLLIAGFLFYAKMRKSGEFME